jgi:hypothetical protein
MISITSASERPRSRKNVVVMFSSRSAKQRAGPVALVTLPPAAPEDIAVCVGASPITAPARGEILRTGPPFRWVRQTLHKSAGRAARAFFPGRSQNACVRVSGAFSPKAPAPEVVTGMSLSTPESRAITETSPIFSRAEWPPCCRARRNRWRSASWRGQSMSNLLVVIVASVRPSNLIFDVVRLATSSATASTDCQNWCWKPLQMSRI